MREQLRIKAFHIFVPAGAARGKLRKRLFNLPCKAFDKLGAFFPYGDICGELIVPYVVKAQHLQSCQHLSRGYRAHRHAETFSKPIPDSRSRHGDYLDLRIFDFFTQLPNPGLHLVNGSDRAMSKTLPAIDADFFMRNTM